MASRDNFPRQTTSAFRNDFTTRTTHDLPAFLKSTQLEIDHKFSELDDRQELRFSQSARGTSNPALSRWARASGDEIVRRNRYQNIDPWNANRVRLRVPAGQSDYINASPISLPGTSPGAPTRRFIATQGPKELSLGHYWSMVWHSAPATVPAVIVMLTQTHEAGREKCFQYFPTDPDLPLQVILHPDDDSQRPAYFAADIALLETHNDASCASMVRKMLLRNGETGEEKVVWHFFFSGWPDFGVPHGPQRNALLHLVRRTLTAAGSHDNPRIVHCSAGVGRSGTFIALDYLLAELDDGAYDNMASANHDGAKDPPTPGAASASISTDPIASVVDNLRAQRMMMVQGEVQFQFLYEVLRAQFERRHGRGAPETGSAEGENGADSSL